MNIDDFMNEAESYNLDSDTVTGFFGLDNEVMTEKANRVLETAKKADKKSDIFLKIDAITDSKVEAIILSGLFFETAGSEDVQEEAMSAIKVAMSLALCLEEGLIDDDNMNDIHEVFAKVFSSM